MGDQIAKKDSEGLPYCKDVEPFSGATATMWSNIQEYWPCVLGGVAFWGVARYFVNKFWPEPDNSWTKSCVEVFSSPWRAFESVKGERKAWRFTKNILRWISYWISLALVVGFIFGRQRGEILLCVPGAIGACGSSCCLTPIISHIGSCGSACLMNTGRGCLTKGFSCLKLLLGLCVR